MKSLVTCMRLLLIALLSLSLSAQDFRPPAGTNTARRRVGAESILPGGRMVEPLGRQFPTGSGAFGLAVSPDGRYAVTADGGRRRFSVTILDMNASPWSLRQLKARQGKLPAEPENDDDDWRSIFLGLAFEDNTRLFASEGNSGRVRHIQIPSGRLLGSFDLNQGGFADAYAADIAYDASRQLLYVVDQANFRVAVFHTRSRRLLGNVRVGRLPFKLALSPDQRRLYVTNLGMFQYSPLPGADAKRAAETGLRFPAFGFPSPEAEKGVRAETAQGPIDVPGLGDPNAPESNSLAVIDVENPEQPRLVRFVRTGKPFGPQSQGGSSPNGVAANATSIYVSNGNQDSITVIDAATLEVRTQIDLRIAKLEAYRGILPLGMALDPAGGRLYVAEAGINAVGVVDLGRDRLIGHLAAGWFPTAVALDRGQVFVASAKGLGTGPNATRTAPLAATFQAELTRGVLSIFSQPQPRALPILTERVMALNGFLPAENDPPPAPREIKYVVLIVKENRTFDEVYGYRGADGGVRGAPELARFGNRAWLEQTPGSLKVRQSGKKFHSVAPNHHALADRYAISDNFYADAEVSVDGHHWIVGNYPNAWVETTRLASYGGQKDFRFPTTAPGRLSNPQSNSSVHPEDQLENGAIWHHFERHGVPFRNFGEGFELAGVDQSPGLKPTGSAYLTNVPMPDPLFRNTSRNYPGYNMNIPDQYRATQFIAEMNEMYLKPGKEIPRFLFLHLPNDHLARPRPEDGYPFQASYMADNDYALGRIVEFLSKTEYWKNMAILITEDDAQGGVDHVDTHRTIFLAVSPYARRNYVSTVNSSFPGLLKTVFRLLNLPPLNLYDATAADLLDCFSSENPDFAPYEPILPDPEVLIPDNVRDPLDPRPQPAMDSPGFLRRQHEQRP